MNITTEKINLKLIDHDYIIKTKQNTYSTFFKGNIDCLAINNNGTVLYKYRNMPKYKSIKIDNPKNNTNILILPCNTSKEISIGDILIFEDKHII